MDARLKTPRQSRFFSRASVYTALRPLKCETTTRIGFVAPQVPRADSLLLALGGPPPTALVVTSPWFLSDGRPKEVTVAPKTATPTHGKTSATNAS